MESREMDALDGSAKKPRGKLSALGKMLCRVKAKNSTTDKPDKNALVESPDFLMSDEPQPARDPHIFAEEEEYLETSFLDRLFAKRQVHVTMFVIMVIYGIFQVTTLWLWVADALSKEKALVFGPPSEQIVTALLVVAVLGSLTFGCEIAGEVYKHVAGTELLSEDATEVATMCIDEIPTVTMSALLAACWEVPLSLYQLIRACGSIFGAFFRSIRVLKRYVEARRSAVPTARPRLTWAIRTAILTACVYCLIGSILVWVFTFQNPDGSFRKPHTIKQGAYEDGRYFHGAGVYLSHPALDKCAASQGFPEMGQDGGHWVKMAGIYEIQSSRRCWFELFYSSSNALTHTLMEFPDGRQESWFDYTFPNCTPVRLHSVLEKDVNVTLHWNETQALLETESFFNKGLDFANDTSPKIESQNTLEDVPPEVGEKIAGRQQGFSGAVRFSLQGTDASKLRVFGDVVYKAAMIQPGTSAQYLRTDEWGFLRQPCTNQPVARFQYFKARVNVTDTSTFCEDSAGPMYRAYVSGSDIRNVTEAWKTGYRECAMTGSLRPNPDETDLTCQTD